MTIQITAGELVDTLTPLRHAVNLRGHATGDLIEVGASGGVLSLTAASFKSNNYGLKAHKVTEVKKAELPTVLVPFKPLIGMASLSDGPDDKLEIDLQDSRLTVTSPSFRMRLNTEPVNSSLTSMRPTFVRPEEAVKWSGAPGMKAAAAFVSKAASSDDGRPILNGVYVHAGEEKGVALAGTDSYRLSVMELEGDAPPSDLLVPARYSTLLPSEESTIMVNPLDHWMTWVADGIDWSAHLIHGEFPNYRSLLPQHNDSDVKVVVDRDRIKKVLDRVSKFSKMAQLGINTPVVLEIDPSGISFSIGRSGSRHESEFFEYMNCTTNCIKTRDIKVAFNPDYLLQGIRAISHPVLNFTIRDDRKPALIHSEGFRHIVMPVRVS